MKIVIVNHSDTLGGASVVSRRLLDALVASGIDAGMIVARASGKPDPRITEAASPLRTKAAFLAEEGLIFTHNGFCRRDLFKVDAGRFGLPLHRHPWIREADIVMLNWVNQGMLSLAEIGCIAAMGKRIVWTMHDMWPLTGICHHAGECREFTASAPCGRCPFIHTRLFHPELSRSTALRKERLYDRADIDFVAVSSWLGEKARESTLLGARKVTVIPNAFPIERFSPVAPLSRAEAALPSKGPLIAMGAARLDDPVKGFTLAIEALNRMEHDPVKPTAIFFGDIRNPEVLGTLKIPYVHLGRVSNPSLLASIYAHSAAVLSTSLYETLPGTLIEGQAAGAWPVSFDRGGQADIITSADVGTLASFGDTETIAAGLREAISGDTPERRRNLHKAVASSFSSEAVVRRYLALLGLDS